LILWGNTLVDGHNRYAIAEEYGLKYSTIQQDFANKYEAIDWIIKNQLGRRNVTNEQKSYLRGIRYENEKAKVGGNHGNQHTKVAKDHNDLLPKNTAQRIAKEINVSEPTIKRNAQVAKGLDVIAEVSPEKKAEVLRSESDLTKKEVSEFARIEKEKQAAIARAEQEAEARQQAEHDFIHSATRKG